MEQFYREGRLADDLPRLILENVRQIPAHVSKLIDESVNREQTGLFDTHPCTAERISASRQENATGIFVGEGPAKSLFSDFTALAINTTTEYYRDVFGATSIAREFIHSPNFWCDKHSSRKKWRR